MDNYTAIDVFKFMRNLAPQYPSNLFKKYSACASGSLHNTNTYVRFPKMNATQGQKAFSFSCAKTWNSLPIDGKLSSSLRHFMKAI